MDAIKTVTILVQALGKFEVMRVYSFLAPFTAPAPSAYVLGVNVYHSILKVSGPENWVLAAVVACIGMIGIEFTGGMAAILVSKAIVKKSWSIMWLALAAVGVYACFVGWGIYVDKTSSAMITTVAITLLCYMVVGLWEAYKLLEVKEVQAVQLVELEVRKKDADRLYQNSLNRGLKLSNGQAQLSSVSTGQTGHHGGQPAPAPAALNPVVLAAVIEVMRKKPDAVTREIVDAGVGLKSPQSALKYRAAALDIIKNEVI